MELYDNHFLCMEVNPGSFCKNLLSFVNFPFYFVKNITHKLVFFSLFHYILFKGLDFVFNDFVNDSPFKGIVSFSFDYPFLSNSVSQKFLFIYFFTFFDRFFVSDFCYLLPASNHVRCFKNSTVILFYRIPLFHPLLVIIEYRFSFSMFKLG